MGFNSITPEKESDFIAGIISGSYSLLLGAGASHDSINNFGNLPLSHTLLQELISVTKEPSARTLQQAFSLLDDNEVEEHITKRLSGSVPGETVIGLSRYNWRRIFTFNVDDCMEAAYTHIKHQKIHPFHFSDPYEEFQSAADLPLIYLHGTVKQSKKGYVFSRDQYIEMIRSENPWMVMLSSSLKSDPVIISGSSLDEVDLEYYLTFRNNLNAREDVAPSIYVSSESNRLVDRLCEKHKLLHFVGHSIDFVNYLKTKIPSPPPIEERIAAGVREILPSAVDRSAAMLFDADFELVPRLNPGDSSSNKFFYGAPPSWIDLAAQLDIPRSEAPIIAAKSGFGSAQGGNIVILFGATGSGKTAILRRTAFNLAGRGKSHILWASELGRLSRSTASTLDAIDGSVVLVVDNFADHAPSILDVLSRLERDDITIIGGERSYRKQYLDRTFGTGGYDMVEIKKMDKIDVDRLVNKLTDRMLVGSHLAVKKDRSFISSLSRDPIAVATCRVLNDFRPLSRIVDSLLTSSNSKTTSAFAAIAIAAHCFKGGLKFSIASSLADTATLQSMMSQNVGLGLRYVDGNRQYITVENSTISDEILFSLSRNFPGIVLDAFVDLANSIAPFVNRGAIRSRSPEARLSGRLFDYDDVVEKFLGQASDDFYDRTKDAWRWNSRYWEQTALLKLTQFDRSRCTEEQKNLIETALQNARYSVAIEEHPFGLTTLGKVLMKLQDFSGPSNSSYYSEAHDLLVRAIYLESKLGRTSVHPYANMIFGTASFLEQGGKLSANQLYEVQKLADYASRRWQNEQELFEAINRIRRYQ